MKVSLFLGVLALAQGFANSEPNCDDNAKLKYESGKSYVYNVELVTYDQSKHAYDYLNTEESDAALLYSSRVRGKITISGKVVLTALENCRFVLTLQNVVSEVFGERVREVSDSRNGSVPRTSMLFTFKNGEVHDLHKQQGHLWTENVIRGILTMIQNRGMGNTEGEQTDKETNIMGHCVARVFIPEEGTFTKVINPIQCSRPVITPAEGVSYLSPTFPVQIPNHHRHWTSSLRCQQKLKDRLLSEVKCTESRESPKKFHAGDTIGVMALDKVAANTEEVGGATSSEIASLSVKTCIKYDARHGYPDKVWEKDAVQEIQKILETMYSDSNSNKAELYLRIKEKLTLVRNFTALEEILENGEDCMQVQFARKMVRDVAAEIGTEGAVLYVSQLLRDKELHKRTITVFHTHLPFTKDPTLEGLKALDGIIQDSLDEFNNGSIVDAINVFGKHKKLIRQQTLGVSAYVYQFCRRNPSCTTLPEYKQLIDKIAQFSTSNSPDIVHAALHALGNVPSLPDGAVKVVKDILDGGGAIINGGTTKLLTTFEAFRRDPCQPTLKKATREYLKSSEKSLDIRITAYLAVSRCVDEEDLKTIQGIFQQEPKSALSSFIASHYHNIMDSQSPSKNYLRNSLLSQISVPLTVPAIHRSRTASKFVEYSSFDPKHNFGFSSEATIFFNNESPIPNFVHLNSTIDSFGKSYNNFQVGISRRLVPEAGQTAIAHTVANYYDLPCSQKLVKLASSLFSVDSYYRMFGTTLTMGVDVVDILKSHKFFDYLKDVESQKSKTDLVKAFTLLDHQITVPTVSGLPMSFTAQMAYLPMISTAHSGDPDAKGLWDLVTRWEEDSSFYHNTTASLAFIAGFDMSIGKGTPVHMGYQSTAKIHVNRSIGFESFKSGGNWVKTIHFPDSTVASARITAAQEFYLEYNGREFQKWLVYGNKDTTMCTDPIISFGGMGLQVKAQVLNQQNGLIDGIISVEKAEEGFTGYGLAFEITDSGEYSKLYSVKATANGLTSEDAVRLFFNFTNVASHELSNDNERPTFGVVLYGDFKRRGVLPVGFQISYKSVGQLKSVLKANPESSEAHSGGFLYRSLGVMRPEYSFEFDIIEEGKHNRMFGWNLNNGQDSAKTSVKFSGPLEKLLGEMSAEISAKSLEEGTAVTPVTYRPVIYLRPVEAHTKVTLKSDVLGYNEVAVDYSSKDPNIWSNVTAQISGVTYSITHHFTLTPPRDKGGDDTQTEVITDVKYSVDYKDSNSEVASMNAEFGFRRDFPEGKVVSVRNASIRATSTKMKDSFIVEATEVKEYYNGPDRAFVADRLRRVTNNLYVDAFGKKQTEITFDLKIKEKTLDNIDNCVTATRAYVSFENGTGAYHCVTHTSAFTLLVADQLEFLATHSNDKYTSAATDIRAYHIPSKTKFNMTSDLNYPPERHSRAFETKTLVLLEKAGENWKLTSDLEVDLENRTVDYKSEKRREGKESQPEVWTATAKGNWTEGAYINGDAYLDIQHTDPRHTVTTINIANNANMTGEFYRNDGIHTNTLTAVIDQFGRAKIQLPKKKFTWVSVWDTHLSEQEKSLYDYSWRHSSVMKLEQQNVEAGEKFRYQNEFKFVKEHNKEVWEVKNGHFDVAYEGKEKASLNYDAALYINSEMSGNAPSNQTFTIMPYPPPSASTSQSPKTHITYRYSLNGWFVHELPSLKNHTMKQSTFYDVYPSEYRMTSDSDVVLRFFDMKDGQETFLLDGRAYKNVVFKDIFHFIHDESVSVNVNNETTTIIQNIRVNGPHAHVYIKNRMGKEQDTWLVDFDAGVFEERHQHKFKIRAKSEGKIPVQNSPQLGDFQIHHHHGHFLIPNTNFNLTVSRR